MEGLIKSNGFIKVRFVEQDPIRKTLMSRLSSFEAELVSERKVARREKFRAEMERTLSWRFSVRNFAKLWLIRGIIPDETTILNFRHILEKHDFAAEELEVVNLLLTDQGITAGKGTIVSATIIEAPNSTKNASRPRDSETERCSQWSIPLSARQPTFQMALGTKRRFRSHMNNFVLSQRFFSAGTETRGWKSLISSSRLRLHPLWLTPRLLGPMQCFLTIR